MTKGFTSGCFNLLHPGHVYFLNQCRKMCSELFVAIASDKITTQKRVPIINEEQRMYMIENLGCVDLVDLEGEELPPNNIRSLLEVYEPDFYFTNSDNPNLEVYRKLCEELDIGFVVMTRNNKGIFDISTTKIIEGIKEEK